MTAAVTAIRIRDIPALAGLRWIRLALRAFARQPFGFMGMFALFFVVMFVVSIPVSLLMPLATAISMSPIVVAMLSLVLMPLLSLAFMLATEAVTNDVRIRPPLFFVPLRGEASTRRSLLAIGLVYVGLFMLAWFAGNGLDGGETSRWFTDRMMPPTDGTAPAVLPELGDTARRVMGLKMAIVALGTIPLWHAPPLILWGRYGAAKAMFASVVALWRTRAAMAMFGLGWFALSFLVTTALALLELLLGGSTLLLVIALTVSWALSALFYVTLWFGFVDTFEIVAPAAP
jgi:hypothetical protein